MKVSKADIKYFRSLSQKKIRQTERKFVLEGWRALKEVLNSSSKIETVAVLARFVEDPDYASILGNLAERGVAIKELSETELKQVSDTVHAQGVLAVVHQKLHTLESSRVDNASMIVAADAISDPGNLGTIVRSADWFAADTILLGRGTVDVYNEKVVRSTVGSIFHIPIIEGVDLPSALARLKGRGFTIISFSGDGKLAYTSVQRSSHIIFVFGSEAHGISQEVRSVSDAIVRIPKYGRAESLNVGVACGIVLSHWRAESEKKKGD